MKLKNGIPSMILICGMLLVTDKTVMGQNTNPFMEEYNTPYGVPPFNKITIPDFVPAFQEGMKQQQQAVMAIYRQRSVPTFQNTIVGLEESGKLLSKVSTVFFNLSSANTSPELEAISKQMAPELSKHSDDIYLNADLFKRVKAVYDKREGLKLNIEQKRLLDKTYKGFVRSGANLNAAQQVKMRAINKEFSLLTLNFGQHLLAEVNNFELLIDQQADLAGLPESVKSAAAQSAKQAGKEGKWRFTLHTPSVMPFLQYSENRALREKMYNAYINRGNNNDANDNKKIISRMVALRAEKAGLLGYNSHADFVLEESMAKSPREAYGLLNGLWDAALPVARQEATDMQKMMDKEGKNETLEAWDWSHYADKVRKERYNYDAEELRPYFKLDNVREGFFKVANKLYGITFTALTDVPVYHKDVTAYQVKEADGTHIGVIYMDFFTRSSKRGGAWMTSYATQSYKEGKRVPPVVSIVCNFSGPNGEEPALFTADEVTTFYHEMGHALHGLLSNVKYRSLAGTSVPRDFVELPSQVMEHFAFEPEVLQFYAKHYKTGAIVPQELITKMKNAGKFNQGFETVEYLAASLLDMGFHTIPAGKEIDALKFETAEMNKYGLIRQIAPRYRSTYFQHIFASGYSAGYYSYIWSAVLDSDAFAAFKESGNIFDPEVAKSFRKNVLEKGGTIEPMDLYKAFRGKEPDMKHLLKDRGLNKAL
ncbi:peptidyl-dipeptidase Dcp [Pedobacter steynii]|uniref:Peptidyl-dipeptidase Dcp n=1 Tax=Pedobacter steynii TaxID=430522 RepID=A0A1H0ECQ4_9SPHI|nr:M3 family metallopeptidase [Pedobacter steynii]NQX41980.1 M3 family metallopeptidase [Pedobacter steynii]SDN80083.1 peptidyl-dipeptidase Dcp [Pedobacter steynii]